MKKIIELLELEENTTEDQVLEAISALRAENKALKSLKYRGKNLTPEQEEGVLRRQRAGLSMEDAITAELAQAKHDEAIGASGKGKKGVAAVLLFLGLLLSPFRSEAQLTAGVITVPAYTNSCVTTNNGVGSATSPAYFAITPGGQVSVMVSVLSTNAGTPNQIFGFQGSYDATNWTSQAVLNGTLPLAGSNLVATGSFTWTNVSYNFLRWYSWGNGQTAAVALAGAPMQAITR